MLSREDVKVITDKVLNMAKADAVEVDYSGGELSATRFANSTITTNLVQFDQQVTITVRFGQKSASATTRELDDDSLKDAIEQAQTDARKAKDNPDLVPLVSGPQEYTPIDAALPNVVNFGPGERAQMVKKSIEITEKKGVLGSGYIPKVYQTTCSANSEGLFAYFRYAEAGFVLTCRMGDGGGSGWSGITGAKNIDQIDVSQLTEVAANKALASRKPRALEPGRYTVILEPRPAARFLSLMMGAFNARNAESGLTRHYFAGAERGATKIGQKLFSDNVTIKSDIGNPILRQTPVGPGGMAARPITWVDKGVLTNLFCDRTWAKRQNKAPTPTTPVMSLVMDGTDASIEQMVRTTRRGLLITFFWYIRPVDTTTLLNTGMTRDGLFLIENGEIVGPVQNFRWNMSPLVGFNNVSMIGKPAPIHTGEAYDGPGTALVPPVRIEDFYMTSVSPAV